MARRTIEERIARLEAQKKSLQARRGKQERARDTRRKVLLGALVLQRLEAGHDPAFNQAPRRLASPRAAAPSSPVKPTRPCSPI